MEVRCRDGPGLSQGGMERIILTVSEEGGSASDRFDLLVLSVARLCQWGFERSPVHTRHSGRDKWFSKLPSLPLSC
jgi:hypothetical protein